jgi:hypothetical protein
MLLKLDRYVNKEKPILNYDPNVPASGAPLEVFGLGVTRETPPNGNPQFPDTLQITTVYPVGTNVCKAEYAGSGLSITKAKNLCAAAPGKDSCQGELDSSLQTLYASLTDSPWLSYFLCQHR